MRIVTMLAAVAALWAVPAHAVVDLKNGVFSGTIASGSASVSFLDAPTIVLDLTGLFVTFTIDTSTTVEGFGSPYGQFIGGFSIPGASNQNLRGFNLHGMTFPDELVTKDASNFVHVLGAVAGTNNAIAQFDLSAPVVGPGIQALTGNLKFTYHGFGSDFVDAKYDFTVANLSGYATAAGVVPEPATWALMIIGIGIGGGAMRRRRRVGSGHIALSA